MPGNLVHHATVVASNSAEQIHDLRAKVQRLGEITALRLKTSNQLLLVGKQLLTGIDQLLEVGVFHD